MARPRTISDQRIVEAAGAVIARMGPGFTLAEVAREAGVAVGSVSGRFGSKHGLLVAVAKAGTADMVESMRAAAAAESSPVVALREAAVTSYAHLGGPAEAANHLGQLGVDIGDPELRGLLAEHFAATEAELAGLAARAGLPCGAARVLQGLLAGIALDWSIRPQGTLVDRLRADLTLVLEGWT
ncbi:TetR/AcrR family transcriptional regulator [Labedaea rhizosphaerae]|uniref:TetR/AcrR family transcriptional regulator n=1 Tax=Labedaea rhizosphaerae TaxID=598644 RepID=UPI00105FA639|nr:TetR/AcrR family transcriptional regulator [Labedaea rhizosphaerae]